MSEWLILALVIVVTCAVVVAIAFLRQKRAGDDDDPSETPDVIEYMTMMIGVVYAIVLGLAIAGVWEARDAADEAVHQEAQALYEVSQQAQVFPAPARERIRDDVHAYVRYTVGKEWPYMASHGELTAHGGKLLATLRKDVLDLEPGNVRQEQTYQTLADRVAATDAARADRESSAGPTMPGVVWFGLIAGAVVSVGMLFTLQIQRSGRELVLAGLFTALIAFLLFLVWHFDAPYTRGLSDPLEAYTTLFPHVT